MSPPPELRAAGLASKRSLGQHFLTSASALRRIADAAELTDRDTVIEIGAGLGALTAELSSRAQRVIAIEKDDALCGLLLGRFAGTNVQIVHGDALEIEPGTLAAPSARYVLVGNLPYNVAQPLLRHYLEAANKPDLLLVMVQAEVAESIVARAGDMSLLACSVQLYGEPRLLFKLAPAAFYPPPKVQSAVVRIDVSSTLRADVDDVDAFFAIARAGFSTRRKQLRNALANGLRIDASTAGDLLAAANINATLRAQDLSLDQWAALTKAWQRAGRPDGIR